MYLSNTFGTCFAYHDFFSADDLKSVINFTGETLTITLQPIRKNSNKGGFQLLKRVPKNLKLNPFC